MELHHRKVVIIVIGHVYCIPDRFLFLQKIIPRAISRITTNTDIIGPAMLEASEVTGVFAWTLEDVVVLAL